MDRQTAETADSGNAGASAGSSAGSSAASPTVTLGRYGEQMAARYLQEQGVQILERNWRCELGEIDIIALDGSCLVVCEVKTRRSTSFGPPVAQITVAKLARLRRLSAAWLAVHDVRVAQVRIDVIGVLRPRRGACQVHHLVSVSS
ncbi:MAG: YraN family protein [Lapillicoccus sp.]